MNKIAIIVISLILVMAVGLGATPTATLLAPVPAVFVQPDVVVSIDAPDEVDPDSDFTAEVAIDNVENLDTARYDIVFDATVLRLDNVTDGAIDGTAIPVAIWNPIATARIRVVNNVPGLAGVTGNGTLAVLHFHVIGDAGDESTIDFLNGLLGDNLGVAIATDWVGDAVTVTGEAPPPEEGVVVDIDAPGDANGDGVVNALDITKVEQIIVGLDAETPGADANEDGVINGLDITKVEKIIVGLD